MMNLTKEQLDNLTKDQLQALVEMARQAQLCHIAWALRCDGFDNGVTKDDVIKAACVLGQFDNHEAYKLDRMVLAEIVKNVGVCSVGEYAMRDYIESGLKALANGRGAA